MPLDDDLDTPCSPQELSRRKALLTLSGGALAIAGGGTAVAVVRYLQPAVLPERPGRFPVGRAADIAPGAVLVLRQQRALVVRGPEGFHALSASCTHLGCLTRLEEDTLFCACHGARFALSGEVKDGPAPLPLRRLLLLIEDGELILDTTTEVRAGTVLSVPA